MSSSLNLCYNVIVVKKSDQWQKEVLNLNVKVARFKLDHTKVKAPYVRLAEKNQGPRGDII